MPFLELEPPPHAFATTITAYSSCSVEEIVEELFSRFSTEAKVHFTHSDLPPRNILVEGLKITVIID
jgi:RIO-like serine/threonine protein kinase